MVPELEKMQKPRITEIQVRMDCNGCVQKIKKALHGINGIYDLYIDFPQQKLTIIGWADPEKIVKAIKKTRKIATICSHIEPSDPPTQPAEPAPAPAPTPAPAPPEGGGQPPAPDAATPPPTETPPAAAAPPPAEPPKDPPPPENPAPQATPSPVAAETAAPQQPQHHHHGPKDIEEIHIIHHHPPDYGHGYSYGGPWSNYPSGRGFRPEPPYYVTHSYDTYKPSPSITAFEYVRSPPRYTRYSRPENYSEDYHHRGNSSGNNITSMFSDENPNACRIV